MKLQNIQLSRNLIITTFFLCIFLISNTSFAQNKKVIKTPKENSIESQFPRLEIYREVDLGNPNSGSNQWKNPSGNTVYGGKRDHQPHIVRTLYLLNEKQFSQILQTPINRDLYFGKQTENLTLKNYFDALQNSDKKSLAAILPESLNNFYSKKASDPNFEYSNTLLAYEDTFPRSLMVIWLDEYTYFVNNIYYNANINLENTKKNQKTDSKIDADKKYNQILKENEDIIGKGKFQDFLRLSPIFQNKISEGFSYLKIISSNIPLPLDQTVLGVQLTPGMPNTNSYEIKISGDGFYTSKGKKKKVNLAKLTSLILDAQNIPWEDSFAYPARKQRVDDGQSIIISVWKNGYTYRILDPGLSNPNSDVSIFVKKLYDFVGLE